VDVDVKEVVGPLQWRNAAFNFDSLPEALRSLFVTMTRQGCK
jgi:hypothetical protein